MAQVVVTIATRTYRMSCEDGQEAHLQRLAGEVDARMADLKSNFGEIGDQRLAVMVALTVADDLDAARRKIEALEAQAISSRADIDDEEAKGRAREDALHVVIEGAAQRIERVVWMLNGAKD